MPWVREACERARARFGIPETIQHDDLHDGQIFVRDDRYLLLDWGDACVSHPFFTLAVTLDGVIAWGVDDVEASEADGAVPRCISGSRSRSYERGDLVASRTIGATAGLGLPRRSTAVALSPRMRARGCGYGCSSTAGVASASPATG